MSAVNSFICAAFVGVLLVATHNTVRGDFILTVNFINYTNPTGLCAECQTRLAQVTIATQLVPVCCDELPFRTDNCSNTGEARCDTRFRWAIRPFGGSLETRPVTVPNAQFPPYFFTPCPQSSNTCPFSEMSTTFGQGNLSFLGVTPNPLSVSSREAVSRGQLSNDTWTGQVQFFIEALDSGLPNIIDSLLVNLDNLQLGAAFTEEKTFTGFHNISHMTMSFKVECTPGFCGDDCLSTPASNRWIAECQANGDFICINSGLNPLPSTPTSPGCTSCLHNLDISTDCTSCLGANFDPATNCSTCFPGYDITSNCTSCLMNRDPSTNCTQCLPGWDITSDCTSCLPRRDPATNCSLCLQPDQFTDTDCTVCSTPGGDPTTFCETCLPNFNPATNCTECTANYNLTTNCTQCLPGWDITSNCASCLSGFTGEDCDLEPSNSISVGLVGGIAGGVGGALFLVIVVLGIILCVLIYQGHRGHAKLDGEERIESTNAYNLDSIEATGTGTGDSTDYKFGNQLYANPDEAGTSSEHMFTNTQGGSAYSQLHHPSVSPPSHTMNTGTGDFSMNGRPREATPVYDCAESNGQPPVSKENTREGYSLLRHPTERSITLQPVPPPPFSNLESAAVNDPDNQPIYDEAAITDNQPIYDEALLPPDTGKNPPKYPSKTRAGYEDVDDIQPALPKDDIYSELDDPSYSALKTPGQKHLVFESEMLYDDTVIPTQEPIATHEYAETLDVSPTSNPAKHHQYDYVETELDSTVPNNPQAISNSS